MTGKVETGARREAPSRPEALRQELRHKKCHQLLALSKDGGIELACGNERCGARVVVSIETLEALIAAAKTNRPIEIAV